MHVEINEQSPSMFEAERAIVIYRRDREAVATQHPIVVDRKTGQMRLGPGRFVTSAFTKKLFRLHGKSTLSYVPPHVVAMSTEAVAWYEPATKRAMYFKAEHDRSVQALDGVLVPQPPLVFAVRAGRLYVYALREDERPTLHTPLYRAPYWNVVTQEAVCTGTMVIPNTVEPTNTKAWSDAFFQSAFTHLSGGKRWSYPGTYSEMLTDAVALGTFNKAWLSPLGTTLGDVLCGS